MEVRTSVEVEGGRAVVRQVGTGAAAARLRERADLLGRAAGDGVPVVVRTGSEGDGWVLVTEHAGSPLGPGRPGDLASLLRIGRDVARTLEALHGQGIVHGRLTAERVVLGARGRAVVCGLGSPPDHAVAADDVAALARLLSSLLEALPQAGRAEAATRASLVDVLRRAEAEPPERRPSARRLATDLERLTPPRPRERGPARARGAAGPSGTTGAPRRAEAPIRRPRDGRPAVLAIGAGAVLALAVVVGGLARGGASPAAAPSPTVASSSVAAPTPRSGPPQAPTSSTASSPTSSTLPPCVTTGAAPSSPPPAGGAGAGCPQDVRVDGPAVVVDGRRFVVAQAGDEVVVGDWGCVGRVRAAVLHPASGVVVVSELPDEGGPVVVRAERVPDARRLAAGRDGGGCPTLLVVTRDGPVRLT